MKIKKWAQTEAEGLSVNVSAAVSKPASSLTYRKGEGCRIPIKASLYYQHHEELYHHSQLMFTPRPHKQLQEEKLRSYLAAYRLSVPSRGYTLHICTPGNSHS